MSKRWWNSESLKVAQGENKEHLERKQSSIQSVVATLEAQVQEMSDGRCRILEEELLKLQEGNDQQFEEVWEKWHLRCEELKQNVLDEMLKLLSPTVSIHGSSLSPGTPAFIPLGSIAGGAVTASSTSTSTTAPTSAAGVTSATKSSPIACLPPCGSNS